LQALHNWNVNIQLTNECKSTKKRSRKALFTSFPKYTMLTKFLNPRHATWQIDTIKKLSERHDDFLKIRTLILPQKPRICYNCDKEIHTTWNCAHAKKQAQLRRYKLSKNERKDNQVGDYACRQPFQLLKDTLIPQQVFNLYEKEFISFYCE